MRSTFSSATRGAILTIDNHQTSFDDQVGPESFIQSKSRKFNRHWHLANHAEAPILKLLGEDGFVNRLEKTGTQVMVQMECGIHHHG